MDKRLDTSSGDGYSFLELVNYLDLPTEEGPIISHIGLASLRNTKFGTQTD